MRLLALLAAVALPVLLVAAPVPKAKRKATDEDALRGVWKVNKLESAIPLEGLSQEELDNTRFAFEGGGVLRIVGSDAEGKKWTFKLDPGAKPKTVDLSPPPSGGDDDGDALLGLYELDGDTLKVCFTFTLFTKQKRPEEIKVDGNATVEPVS